jgi:hypothetical protein
VGSSRRWLSHLGTPLLKGINVVIRGLVKKSKRAPGSLFGFLSHRVISSTQVPAIVIPVPTRPLPDAEQMGSPDLGHSVSKIELNNPLAFLLFFIKYPPSGIC